MHRSNIQLPCDLCDEKLASRAAFDAHMRDVHGTVSLKPQLMLKKIDSLIASMPQIPGQEDVRKLSLVELEERIRKRDEKDRTCLHCGDIYDTRRALEEHQREARQDMEEALLRSLFKTGWLTFRAKPNEVDGMVSMPMDMGVVKVNFIHHPDGSWIQFSDARMRDRYVRELKSYLQGDSDLLDVQDRRAIEKFIGYAETAKPWEGLPRGHGRHRGT